MRVLALIVILETLVLGLYGWHKRAEAIHWVKKFFQSEQGPLHSREDTTNSYFIALTRLSTPPFPDAAPYSDCLSVCEGVWLAPGGERIELLVALPAFLERKWTDFSKLSPNSQIAAELVPFETIPKRFQAMARVDESDRFDLPLYFASSWEPIDQSLAENLATGPASLPTLPKTSPPAFRQLKLNPDAIAARIDSSREQINAELSTYRGGWDQWFEEANRVRSAHRLEALSKGGYFWERSRYYYRPASDSPYATPAKLGERSLPVRYLSTLKSYFAERGTHLLLVPFPWPEETSHREAVPDLPAPSGFLYPERQKLLLELLSKEIDVLDPLRSFHSPPESHQLFYDNGDNHPADTAILLTAKAIADTLERYGVPRSPSRVVRRTVRNPLKQQPDGPEYPFTLFLPEDDSLPERSDVLLLGDSFLTVPDAYGVSHANLQSHLAWELGYRPRTLVFPGQSGKVLHHLRRHSNELEGLSLVVFVCSSTFLTGEKQYNPYLTIESDWYRASDSIDPQR